ncbi:hypothetical protein SAMN05660464_3692 [Geodermatophilus dictyosporus]|uniref:AAA ATPase domain-containing protein n=1 Tax=Geodermatophilus dictyosporus TaxID=1523247 RepID=A0A1I5RSE0_9ACTN|nr:hypothetical protein SAMN05660464_3692 [Geodermatophilus dictyosporus]
MSNPFSIWPQFGFAENPYSNLNLPGDTVGDRLLVGRDQEVGQLQRRIGSMGTHPTVEGPAGVGKSSLIGVACYRMLRECVRAKAGTLFLPVPSMQATSSIAEFETQAFFGIAQAMIANVDAFRVAGLTVPDVARLNNWLNDPTFRQAQGSALGFGAGGGAAPNTSEGFASSGFPQAVRAELDRCLPGPGAGAMVCLVDNLELLQTTSEARTTLEALRDRVFNLSGTRWVLCGSRGIVSRARSERLSGIFEAPLRVGPLTYHSSLLAVERRLEEYGSDGAYAPVPPKSFEFIYRALNRNLRDAMAYAQQFSEWLYGEYIVPMEPLPSTERRASLLATWLADLADAAHTDARGIQRRHWQFFDQLAEAGGTCRLSEWEAYFSRQQNMSNAITALDEARLVSRSVDPDNASRSMATITPLGWLVYFHRSRYGLPSHGANPTVDDVPDEASDPS